jgi:PufQ cytochrome subunit
MSDHTAGEHGMSEGQHAHRTPHAEFYVYFALIFVVAVPISLVAWVVSAVSQRRLPVMGPLARAWREAGAITPAIFRP